MVTQTLSLTSPLTKGPRVLSAQRILNGGNVYAKDFLQGSLDGVFGEETGRACIRAKYWLGYPTAALKPTYGMQLDAYLEGRVTVTAEMSNRALIRSRRDQVAVPMRMEALNEAKKHIGTKERPAGSNVVRFSKWYGITGPWCAMFVSWCYVSAGSKAFHKGEHYAYVPYIVQDARAGRNGLSVTRDPKPGDVVCYDWDGGVADHTGLFEKWVGSEFDAIEGNTAVGNDSNGGEVMRRRRSKPLVECFVKVGR